MFAGEFYSPVLFYIRVFMSLPRHHIHSFLELLQKVDEQQVSEHPYCVDYFKHIKENGKFYLEIYHRVLETVIEKCNRTPASIRLIDFGCGNGVLGLYARFCGFQLVLLSDHDPAFAQSAERLSALLNVSVEVTREKINDWKNVQADALVATDVIEHIYHLPSFFKTIQQLNPNMIMVFTTAANSHNPLLVKKIKKLQWKDEHEGSALGGLSGNPHPPYRTLREEIIQQHIPIPVEEDALVQATRGMIREDIVKATEVFLKHHTLPEPAPQLNTCHPETGSWTERIYADEDLKSAFGAGGFTCVITPGFYNASHQDVKGVIKYILNLLIPVFGKKIAPWIMITGYKNVSP